VHEVCASPYKDLGNCTQAYRFVCKLQQLVEEMAFVQDGKVQLLRTSRLAGRGSNDSGVYVSARWQPGPNPELSLKAGL